MSQTSNRQANLQLEGVIDANLSFPAAENSSSPASVNNQSLASGTNTITVVSGATAVTIIPPATNTNSITLKGVSGDTGIRLHNTDPTTLALHTTQSTFVLVAGSTTAGVILAWS